MKKLSIKTRVTLWYTLLMLALAVVSLALLLAVSEYQITASLQDKLRAAASDNLEEISWEESGWDVDDDFRTFEDGIYFILYDQDGNPVYGQLPSGISAAQTPAFADGTVQKIRIQSQRWILLDIYKPSASNEGIWMRGMVCQSEAESGLTVIVSLAALLLPLFVVLAALGGHYITYRAFVPIGEIRKTAEEIAGSRDLSRRIRLDGGKDEIHELADTFDGMLDRIQEAFEREKQFTSDASHELRTPTAVIAAQAEYALRYDGPEGELKERLQTILEQSRRMSGMISQLLMLARADQGRVTLQKERIDLGEMLEIIAEEEQASADEKQIRIHTDCRPGVYMEGDETLLLRCFMNLTENAVTYGKEGGNVWISLWEDADAIRGSVRDDGIGISEENLPRIWERFYQADPMRSASTKGNSGLGLAMVKWIVEAHGGVITAGSRLGEGSDFVFCFPKREKNFPV